MMRNCEQHLCDLRATGKCPICKGCKAPPDLVSDYCEQCWCCQHECGFLRGDSKKDDVAQKVMVLMMTGNKQNEN